MDDRALLRDLRQAVQQTESQGKDAQAAAIFAVLKQHGATTADVQRLLGWARSRRSRELGGLQARLNSMIESQSAAEETAAAVDRFLRERNLPE